MEAHKNCPSLKMGIFRGRLLVWFNSVNWAQLSIHLKAHFSPFTPSRLYKWNETLATIILSLLLTCLLCPSLFPCAVPFSPSPHVQCPLPHLSHRRVAGAVRPDSWGRAPDLCGGPAAWVRLDLQSVGSPTCHEERARAMDLQRWVKLQRISVDGRWTGNYRSSSTAADW